MGLHIVILGLLLLLVFGFFVFSLFSQNRIFLVGAFVVLMLSGFLIQAEEGVILGQQVDSFEEDGSIVWSNVFYSIEEPAVLLFSWLLVLVGGALTAWASFDTIFSKPRSRSFHY